MSLHESLKGTQSIIRFAEAAEVAAALKHVYSIHVEVEVAL